MKENKKNDLRCKMAPMIAEANALRSEAAEKMYDVPKGYKLIGVWDDIRCCLMMIVDVVLCIGFLMLFRWSLSGDDVVHIVGAIVCVTALGISMMLASVAKNRPYKVKEHVREYYANDAYYNDLVQELERLKTGIAQYDQQYKEREKYIQKFRNIATEIEDYGGALRLVMKAGDFHAHVKMSDNKNQIDCRLKFTKDGYNQLLDLIKLIDGGAA